MSLSIAIETNVSPWENKDTVGVAKRNQMGLLYQTGSLQLESRSFYALFLYFISPLFHPDIIR